MRMKIIFGFVILGLIQPAAIALASDEVINVHYHDRPPYAVSTPSGMVSGLTASPVVKAFSQAGVQVAWIQTPSNRQLRLVQGNSANDCVLGWFKNAEREQFARFSQPIYRDKPQRVIALESNRRVTKGTSLSALLRDQSLKLLVKSGYSYGPVVDQLLVKLKPQTTVVTGDNLSMLRMLNAGRVDYFFAAVEEIDYLIGINDFARADYQFLPFVELAQGTNRHLMCSRRVSDALLDRFNAHLPQY
ncbi:substrate-binding periplasmic protein [Reinekea forsetii]|jgi:polar amino acid transport system substrate-binding protein|uniref:Extracellular solute-binding protein n=1 Tax=Reinekea forsetii TaxID=1336806 RepID=A0A2K8KT80_9GAMM|nr:transporter substrate-binding domain-containing protein [Reinekea forsetii]ATX77930.1 extracellular solute-binding protein [Reinekea forsetii]